MGVVGVDRKDGQISARAVDNNGLVHLYATVGVGKEGLQAQVQDGKLGVRRGLKVGHDKVPVSVGELTGKVLVLPTGVLQAQNGGGGVVPQIDPRDKGDGNGSGASLLRPAGGPHGLVVFPDPSDGLVLGVGDDDVAERQAFRRFGELAGDGHFGWHGVASFPPRPSAWIPVIWDGLAGSVLWATTLKWASCLWKPVMRTTSPSRKS